MRLIFSTLWHREKLTPLRDLLDQLSIRHVMSHFSPLSISRIVALIDAKFCIHSSDGISQLTFSYGPHLAPLFDIYKKYIIKLKTHKQSISKGKVLFHTYIPFPHPKPRSLSLGLDGPLRCKRLLLFCHAWLSNRVQGILLT